jgi:transposase
MAKPEVITVSMRELDRLKAVQAVVDGELRPGIAAARLGITDRQFRRLVLRYYEDGPSGLATRRRGRPSNNRRPPEFMARVLELVRQHYPDFGPTLASEKLRERDGVAVGKETLRRWMMEAGIWIPRKLRPPKIHQPRRRRACFGELIQIDGCEHDWFEGRGPNCTLLVYVDDATSRIVELMFVPSESTFTYFAATREYLQQYGKPIAFYSDKASVFRVNKPSATGGDGHTQFARALFELAIEGICANSSQGKGRVERKHLTFQDRLVKELRLQRIDTMADGNAFLPAFIADHNRRFAKPPRSPIDMHRPLRDDEHLDLIFTWREPRCVSQSLTIQYDKVMYLLPDTPEHRTLAGNYIDVYEYPDGRVEPRANGHALPFTEFDKLSEIENSAIVDHKRLGQVLQVAQRVQAQRDDSRSKSGPVLAGAPPRRRGRPPGKKGARELNANDLQAALVQRQASIV